MMNSDFQLIIGSPIEYNFIVVSIWFNEREICLLQKEEGTDKIKIEFYFENPIEMKIDLHNFLQSIEEAKIELLKPNKYMD